MEDRKEEEPVEVIKEYEKEYREQKTVTAIMIGHKKGTWEKYKIQEAKADGKKFWNLIKDLLGRAKKKDEEVYIYEGDGSKKKAEQVWGEYLTEWKKKVYEKIPRVDLTF